MCNHHGRGLTGHERGSAPMIHVHYHKASNERVSTSWIDRNAALPDLHPVMPPHGKGERAVADGGDLEAYGVVLRAGHGWRQGADTREHDAQP